MSVIRREAVSTFVEAVHMPAPPLPTAETGLPPSLPSYDRLEDSDVCLKSAASPCDPVGVSSPEVTLFVHGWDEVEPGLLSWTFPSLRAALDAVQRMRNAIGWCVVSGTGWTDLDLARARGAILVEQLN
jgi:hypothetical protein